MTRSGVGIILITACILFTDAAELSSSSGSGKAIYTASRNPISSYFKEHKNKLRPYFARPDSSSSQVSSTPYSQGSGTYDETSASVHSSDLYGHSNYYDGGSSTDNGIYHSAPSTASTKEEHNSYMDLYDSSSPETQASNLMYSVMDPLSGGGGNPGYYGGGDDPLHGPAYSHQSSFHGPGLQLSSNSAGGGSAGYYGAADMIHPPATNNFHHENSVYSSQQGSSNGNTAYFGSSGNSAPPATHHHGNHAPTSNNFNNHNNHDKNNLASDNSDMLFPIPGGSSYGEHEDDEQGSDNEFNQYDYSTSDNSDEDNMLMEHPLFGGGGDDATTPAPTPAATDPTTTDNPLNFLNLVGTDFQPGRLVNIFFGLFIMLFMIIIHGYALWILGIAYLPGTRSLNEWQLDKDKVEDICNLVLDALEYWENKV